MTDQSDRTGPSRRRFLGSAGLLVGGAAVGAGADHVLTDRPSGTRTASSPTADAPVAFEGQHQPGIIDRQPAALRFLALSLADSAASKDGLRSVLQKLSDTARSMMAGRWTTGADDIATNLTSAGLTVSIGIGATGLTKAGLPVPAPLQPLPHFATDQLQPARTGGDLGLQICAEDPMVVAATARALLRAVSPSAQLRWSQSGFLRSRDAADDPDGTPRNLMGQLDGTDNPTGSRLGLAVWVPPGVEPAWMTDGTYLVCRRIRMLLDSWEQLAVPAQEAVIGRRKSSGAPLTGEQEHDNPVFAATANGHPVIPTDAHVRLTHPSNNSGATMLRRGFSYDDGMNSNGELDSGLFFQAFQTDPHRVFVPIQQKLAASDALTKFLSHEGSATFAFPGGASTGGFVGEKLF